MSETRKLAAILVADIVGCPTAKPLNGVHNGGRIGEVRFAELLGPFEVGVQHAQDTPKGRERLHARVP